MEEQQNGMQKPLLQELPVIGDRASFLYLEHCKISREDGAVTARDEDGTVHIPAAAVSVLLLGPGTEVSHRAMELISFRSRRSVSCCSSSDNRAFSSAFSC